MALEGATQLLHGCRQLVPWGVGLSAVTSATLILCCIFHRRLGSNLRPRKERMTSSQHGAYVQGNTHPTMAKNNGLRDRKVELIPEISPQFRLWAAIRPHEVGIGSNRESSDRGEYVLGSCPHRPSSQQSRGYPKAEISVEGKLGDED